MQGNSIVAGHFGVSVFLGVKRADIQARVTFGQ